MTSTYINILTDFGFKRIFADEKNKDLLIDFLNAVMEFQGIEIKDISYKNTEFVGEYEEDKKVILDLYCTNEKGEHFLIEVQRAEQEFFKKRLLFYASRLIQEQGIKGKKWDYNFKGVYSIAILDFDMPKNQEILNSFRILNEKTHEPFIDDFGFVIINLTQFNKQEYELTSNFEKWLYVLRNLDKLKDIPLKLQQHLFVKLFNLAEYSALSKKEQKAYMESLKKYNDFENVLEFAQKKGYNKGYNEATLEFKQVISDIEMLLSEERKRAEEEKKRAEEKEKLLNEEKKRAEQEKQRLIKSIQKMRAMGASDKEIEEILEIKLKEYE
jgi:predicted transposase/invertase (TIGR01784 family)